MSLYLSIRKSIEYIKDYDKNKELPYIQYWNVNNLYGWGNVTKAFSK